MSFSPAGRPNSAPPNPLAGSEGPLQSRGGREKVKEGEGNKGKGLEKTSPSKNKFLVMALDKHSSAGLQKAEVSRCRK